MPENKSLGKLIAIHGTSPAFLQRAAIVSVMSFVFFLATLIAFYFRQNFLYFLLASAFLIVYLFTMIGWWIQKRNAVEIFSNGFKYKKREVRWPEISSVENNETGLDLVLRDHEKLTIPPSVFGRDDITCFIRQRIR